MLGLVPHCQRDPETGRAPFECASCEWTYDQRRGVHCGWIDKAEWREPMDVYFVPGHGQWTESMCPGFLLAQPQIAEASQAAAALRLGAIDTYFPGASAALLEAAMELNAAFQRHEAQQLADAAKKR